jgi:hypothetical protein
MNRHVVVVGGGLAGMTAAYELAKLGHAPLLLERGGHLGGKVMSSEGYGGMPIEHGVHGWWKGYGNFFDVLRELHGPDWETLFGGPYYSRFTAKVRDAGGGTRVVSMNRPPPFEGEPRVMPFVRAIRAMIDQGALSYADVASLVRFLARVVAFDHRRDYAEWRDRSASGVAEDCGVSRRAQELVIANFSLASAFSPLDRLSAAALFSSLHFYVFDAQASLAGRWLRTHPAKVVHDPLCAAIEARGGHVSTYARVLGLARGRGGRVRTVFVDRAHAGVLDARDFHEEPRDLLHGGGDWRTPRKQLAIARATLRHLGRVWIAARTGGDVPGVDASPLAWTGERAMPSRADDARWLEVEWADAAMTHARVVEDRFETLGTIDARDVPKDEFTELLWQGRGGAAHTPEKELARLRKALAAHAHLFTMHAADLTTPPHLPLYVGAIGGAPPRGFAGICTHFGGRVRWAPNLHSFACQLHGSRFACDGQRTCGPAEANLFSFRLAPSKRDPGALDVQVRLPPRIEADHVVLATDVSGLRRVVQSSPTLHDAPAFTALMRLRTTSVTVVRLVLARRVDDALVIFSGFDAIDAMFNVTKLQGVQLDAYRDRVHEVIELQLYRDRTIGELSREALAAAIRRDLKLAYGWDEEPEILEPVHVAVHRDVYSGYDCESEIVRPSTTAAGLEGLAFAGDWVQPDDGAWYMERAIRTGRLAARAVARDLGDDPERVPLVPPVREPWNVRTIVKGGGDSIDDVARALKRLVGLHDDPPGGSGGADRGPPGVGEDSR